MNTRLSGVFVVTEYDCGRSVIGTKTGSELGVKLGVHISLWVPFLDLQLAGTRGEFVKLITRSSLMNPFQNKG